MSKEENTAAKPVTVDDLLKVITALGDSQKDSFLQAAERMAFNIAHPSPTPEHTARTRAALEQRIQQAKADEAMKEHKRKYCTAPATPDAPHRRPRNEIGNFAGQSMIAWHMTRMTKRTANGGSEESGPVFFGVCQWCQTEWTPDSPDYLTALSWGHPTEVGTYSMNRTSGNWAGGTTF